MSINDIRKRFVKDNKLQIPILQSPYFEYFLDSYSQYNTKYFKINEKYDDFVKDVSLIGEEKFIAETFKIADKVSNYVKEKNSYIEFNTTKLDNYNIPQLNIPSKDIFNINNHEKHFISIDLKQANFHSLKHYNSDIIDNKSNYEEFISQFTNIKHIINSKYLRQVIFGKLNPKRISKIETYITYQLLQTLKTIIPEKYICFFSHDEIVLEIDFNFGENGYPLLEISRKIEDRANELGMPLKIEVFQLQAQNPVKKLGFVKKKTDGTIEFKGVQDIFFAQAFKKYFNLPLNENDFIFYHEGQVAKFLSSVKEDNL